MPTQIEIDQLRELLAAGGQLVEVLPADEYEDEHLPGALSIPLSQLDGATTATLDKTAPTIVYCWDYI
jgi:phage shock protein E